MINRKNLSLIIGFSIPIMMILFVAISIYIPKIFFNPKYNFLYSTDEGYSTNQIYSVRNGRLFENPKPTPAYSDPRLYSNPQLYVHNVAANKSVPVTFEEAASFTLDSNVESPDGYKLENGSGGGFFPFFWSNRDYNVKYLVGHNASEKINVKTNGSNYSSIHFLGWIIQ
ncbi:MAG: hypothetical protein Q7K55_02755 [Candidatus Levybacteria bacterium]|nr:hypothetical protein [Candidatus Levybacteria bacterium]